MIKCGDLVEIQDRTNVEEFCIDGEIYKVLAKNDTTLTLQDTDGFSKFNISERQVKLHEKTLSDSDILQIIHRTDKIWFYKHGCTIEEAYDLAREVAVPQFVKKGNAAWFNAENGNISISTFLKEGEDSETA
ncbi:hypothetical protein [Listeria fleischmannii]|uniref:hypothetical protein n=1 Tax=Listeria fleischmannii TaxID=1069827 RepID=UPI00162AB41E|nr:hypothetical protein [Listeria fleischmannii]MBC1420150.1 hypothetical protein [Listeria fleischmannii]